MHESGSPLASATLVNKPSTSFSTSSSKSGKSKLLFGEIDTISHRSSTTYHSACSLVLTSSSTFLRLWLSDDCRNSLLSNLPKNDLANLRLACVDFGKRAAPVLFKQVTCRFRTGSFTKPSRLAALDRIGHHVESFSLELPSACDVLLPPLIDPWTGEEKPFVYKPRPQASSTIVERMRRPKYGDKKTTDMIIRQYPPLFHAATDSAAFATVLCTMPHLKHLGVCSSRQDKPNSNCKRISDYALVSLSAAVEQAGLANLTALSVQGLSPAALLSLSPMRAYGAAPGSLRCWSQIKNLDMHLHNPQSRANGLIDDELKLVQSYLRTFVKLERLEFGWLGCNGPSPLRVPTPHEPHRAPPTPRTNLSKSTHPAHRQESSPNLLIMRYPLLKHLKLENVNICSSQVQCLLEAHSRTLRDLGFEDVNLTSGTWDEALSPLSQVARRCWVEKEEESGDVPIMFETKPASSGLDRRDSAVHYGPRPYGKPVVTKGKVERHAGVDLGSSRMHREPSYQPEETKGGRARGLRRLLSVSKKQQPRKKRDGLWGCEDLKRAFEGSMLQWP